MPPKKPKSKPKGKGKDEKPGKMTKKEKKLRAKYGTLQVDDESGKEVYAVGLRRDELQWAVERLREQVTVNREERIKYQLERDFLYDIMQIYWKKYRCLKIEEEKKIADMNRMNQDADDNKTIKAIEGKHFGYDAQILYTGMDVRDEIRKKKLKEMLERSWQSIALDIEDQNDIIARNAEKYRQKISDTVEKLDDLQKYVDDYANQLSHFTKNLIQQMENSMKLFHLTHRMEMQMTEERWSEFIWKLTRNFELQYDAMKNYYNDATHSNLTMIFTLQDWTNDSIEKMKMYQDKIADYERLTSDAHVKMPALRTEYTACKVKHDFIVRTKQGIKTTKKEIAIALKLINEHKEEFRHLLHQMNSINSEREHIKANCEDLIGDAMEAYKLRYDIRQEENLTLIEVNRLSMEKQRLRNHFPTAESFSNVVCPYKSMMDRKDEKLERDKLTLMRIQKQTDDLRSSLEARLLRVGTKKKHATISPEQGFVFGRTTRLDWGPANLVAKKSYPKPIPPPVRQIPCSYLVEDDTDVKLCLTESIRGFLSWKEGNKQRMEQPEKRESHF